MRYYVVSKQTITINKEGNEDYNQQITVFKHHFDMFESGTVSKDFILNFYNNVREFLDTENFISIVGTEVENEFDVYEFELKADGRVLKPTYDEELKNYYIETEDEENELH